MVKRTFFRKSLPALVTGGPAFFALAAASPQSPLARIDGGLWEVTGAPGSAPVRQCLANIRVLAQFEHRKEQCPRTLVREGRDTAIFQYNCPGGGFGQSELRVLTPRSLRIETQGISGGLPFHYVIQARRVGACAY
jgi:hypothetical protein